MLKGGVGVIYTFPASIASVGERERGNIHFLHPLPVLESGWEGDISTLILSFHCQCWRALEGQYIDFDFLLQTASVGGRGRGNISISSFHCQCWREGEG